MSLITFITDNWSEIIQKTLEHISLSFTAIILACLVGIPVGFLIVNHKKLSSVVLNIANVIQTIPSLALFAFAMPLFGIGKKPAIFALFLYALLPIIKNTLIGIRNVDPATIKAATGMGMSKTQIMFKIEVPLAISVIMGGVRIAAVTCIGITTLATLIAAGGLGDFIYRGLSSFNEPMILTGAIFSALLALLADFILGLLEKKLMSDGLRDASQRKHLIKNKSTRKAVSIILTIVIIACAILVPFMGKIGKSKNTVRIVHKNYTEQRLIGQMMATYLEDKGFNTSVKELGGSVLCHNAINDGNCDVYAEYTGTGYGSLLKQTKILSPDDTYNYVKKQYAEKYNLRWLTPLGYNNTYILSVTKETQKKYNLEKFSDLIPYAPNMLIGSEQEFAIRADGLPGLLKAYPGLEFKDNKSMDQGLTYNALVSGDLDVNVSYSTDGRIAKFKLVNLKDDHNFFPPYYCAPIIREEYAKEHPEVVKALNELGNKFTEEDMQIYNLMVDEGTDVKKVAKKMLVDKGLIKK